MRLKTIERLIKSASTDVTRFQLCGVNVKKLNYGSSAIIQAQATDGYRAVRGKIDSEGLINALTTGESILVTREHLKTFKSVWPKNLRDAEMPCSRDGDSVVFDLFGTVVRIKVNEVRYPEIDQFFKTGRVSPFRIAFDADLLASLAESMHDSKKSTACLLEFDLEDPWTKPIGVTCGGEPVEAVLMPMRSSKDHSSFNASTIMQLKASRAEVPLE